MATLREFVESVRTELPETPLARWASVFFSFSVLTFLISLAASQAFLAASAVAHALHLLRDQSNRGGEFETRPYTFPAVKLPLAMFFLLSLISILWAENPTVGWLAVRKLALFLIWPLAVNLVISARHLEILFKALFVESALAGLVAAAQFIHRYRAARALYPGRVYYYMTLERIRGFMGHWMNFSGQQMLVFAALLAFLLLFPGDAPGFSPAQEEPDRENAALKGGSTHRSRRGIWGLVLAIVGVSIGLSLTRGVWLGCFVATIYLGGRWKPRWLAALPVLLVAAYLAAPSVARQRVRVLLHPSADPSLSIRFEMWQVGLRMVQRHPLVGVGPGNVVEVYTLYLPAGKAPELGYREHLHNNLLQLGAERGLPCLAAWVWLMAALGWHFWRIRRQSSRGGCPTWIADAAIAGWLAFLVEGCFEFNFGTSPVLMVFLFLASTPFVVEQFEKAVDSRRSKVES